MSAPSARMLWNGEDVSPESLREKVQAEKTWCYVHEHKCTNGQVTVSIKAGNKTSALKNYLEQSDTGKNETKLTEWFLHRCYKDLWPLQDYFFYIRVEDRSQSHHPVYHTILDLPTALNVFGEHSSSTIKLVTRSAHEVVNKWNADNATRGASADASESLSPCVIYHEIADYKNTQPVTGATGAAGTPGSLSTASNSTPVLLPRFDIGSLFLVIVGNYSFVKKRENEKSQKPCSLSDVTVGLKIASSAFSRQSATAKKHDGSYCFDKNGALFSLASFLSLLRSDSFVEEFLGKVRDRYNQEQNQSAVCEIESDEETAGEQDTIREDLGGSNKKRAKRLKQ